MGGGGNKTGSGSKTGGGGGGTDIDSTSRGGFEVKAGTNVKVGSGTKATVTRVFEKGGQTFVTYKWGKSGTPKTDTKKDFFNSLID